MKKLLFLLPVVFLVGALIFGGCAPKAPSGAQEIRIGCNTPMTGPFAGFGEGNTYGVQAAVDDVNKLGGVYVKDLGKKLPIKLIVVDNESSAEKSATLEEDLIVNRKVNFQAPPNQPLPTQIPQALIADKYKIPRVSGGCPMEPWLGVRNSATPPFQYSWTYAFSIATPGPKGSYWDKAGYTIMDTWVDMLDLYGGQTNKKVGVFASDEPDGRGWYSLFPPALTKLGYNVIGIDNNLGLFPPGTTDFSSIVTEWKANDVQIIWGNCIGPDFGVLWRQCNAMGFKPKMVNAGRAALYYTDVNAWGGDLPLGVGIEIWWDPAFKNCPGFGDTTPQTLAQRWAKDTGQPLNPGIGWGYQNIQVFADAIERAGSLDPEKVNKALGETDIMTIAHRVKFDENHACQKPIAFGQWHKVDQPWKWECPVVFSKHDFVPATADPIFPIPYQ